MSAAARHLDISQSMVSRTIAGLEREVEMRLFTRTPKGIKATDAAVMLYEEVQRSFRGIDVIAQSAREIREVGTTRLQIVSIPIIATALLPSAIEVYLREIPKARVSFEMRSEITAYRWASSGVCDIAFSSIRREPFHVDIKELYALDGVCAVPKSHPLARRSHLTMRDIVQQRLILPPQNDVVRQRVDQILQAQGLQAAPSVETPYAATVCELVDQGVGIGVVNPLVSGRQSRFPGVVFVPLEDGPIYRGFQLSRRHHANPAIATFSAAVETALAHTLAGARHDGLID